MTKRTNTFAAKMQAAVTAKIAADTADRQGDTETARALRIQAHKITSAAAAEAERDAKYNGN